MGAPPINITSADILCGAPAVIIPQGGFMRGNGQNNRYDSDKKKSLRMIVPDTKNTEGCLFGCAVVDKRKPRQSVISYPAVFSASNPR